MSPFKIERLTDRVVFLTEPDGVDGVRWWIEGRPDEGGRQVLVRRELDGTLTRMTPEGFNARSRVHEYGGAAYARVRRPRRRLRFRDRPAQSGRRARASSCRSRPERAWRYADVDPRCGAQPPHRRSRGPRARDRREARRVGQRARHDRPRDRRRRGPREGADFYAAPRLSPGRHAAGLARVAPPEHALGRDRAAARRRRRRRLARRGRATIAGSRTTGSASRAGRRRGSSTSSPSRPAG